MGPLPVIVRHQSIPIAGLPAALVGLRIAHVSDPHFRRFNRVTEAAQGLLATLAYNLLVVTGDFAGTHRKWAHAIQMTRRFFEPIAACAPTYAVLGNHDDQRIADAPDMPLTFLRNRSVLLTFGGAALELVGVEQSLTWGEDLSAALDRARPGRPTILLAHYPSTVSRLPAGRVDLLLSGHTHAGQIRFPWFGCVWAHDRIPLRLVHGLHRIENTCLHVTSGLGVSGPIHVRFGCPPEINILTLQPAYRPPACPPTASRAAFSGPVRVQSIDPTADMSYTQYSRGG